MILLFFRKYKIIHELTGGGGNRRNIIYQILVIFFTNLEIDESCELSCFAQLKRSAVVEKLTGRGDSVQIKRFDQMFRLVEVMDLV